MRQQGEQTLGEQRGLDKVSAAQFGPAPKTEPHPGDLDYDEWAQRPDVVHHATFADDWAKLSRHGQIPTPHFGTAASAGEVGYDARAAIWGGSDRRTFSYAEAVEGERVGQVHSRRIESSGIALGAGADRRSSANTVHEATPAGMMATLQAVGMKDTGAETARYADAAANGIVSGLDIHNNSLDHGEYVDNASISEVPWADSALHQMEQGKTPENTALDQATAKGLEQLGAKVPLAYRNSVEDPGSTSYAVPPGAGRTWEQDFMDSPNRPEYRKRGVRAIMEAGTPGQTTDWRTLGNVPGTRTAVATMPGDYADQKVFDFGSDPSAVGYEKRVSRPDRRNMVVKAPPEEPS